MPRICYVDKNFKPESLKKIKVANSIIAEYSALNMTLTLRQLYYQFVARDFIKNSQREYMKLSSLMTDARLAGHVDWYALEDRTRFIRKTNHFESPDEMIKLAAQQYRIDKWEDQTFHVEVLIEKDALVGVIEAVCRELDITYASCRGYMSASMMWETGRRLKEHAEQGKSLLVVHLGDHDPSGKHMSVDIETRLGLFLEEYSDKLLVERVALNMDQVEQYNPPPNFAKSSDPRHADYQAEFGDDSWELDALDPRVIAQLIRSAVLEVRNEDLWGAAVEKEKGERKTMRALSENYDDVAARLVDEGLVDAVADEEVEEDDSALEDLAEPETEDED